MRMIRRHSLIDHLPPALRAFASRRAAEMTGLALIVLIVMLMAALASWSVDDPSLNNATDGRVRNLMGKPGAIVSDVLMQLFGLGVVAVLLPPFAWALKLMRTRTLGRFALRLALWLMGSVAAAAVASALPPSDRWPLPTGLGGVVGDSLHLGARNLIGLAGSPFGSLVGFAWLALAVLALTASAGYAFTRDADDTDDPAIAEEDEDDLRADTDPGLGVILVGGLAHMIMTAQGTVRRWFGGGRSLAYAGHGHAGQAETQAQRSSRVRVEPEFGDNTPRAARQSLPDQPLANQGPRAMAPGHEGTAQRNPGRPLVDDRDDDGVDSTFDNEPVSQRVAAPPPPPKPGKRIQREAQPSLLDRDEFTLPALTFLTEPKKAPVAQISTDALEQNATLLEGVLEDFGVRGEITQVRPGPVVTLYELEPAPGTKSSRVISLADDIARSMSAVSARVPWFRAAMPLASNCRTPSARRSSCASCWPAQTSSKASTSLRYASARPSVASRSSPISPRCRTFWWPAPPARASPLPSTP
jgi:DNA segregation ATPase FtsK/SpoIIIE, S-DNA-T family